MNVLILDEELIQLNMKVSNSVEAIEELSNLLFINGYVKESFKQAIKDREEIYPTGLPTETIGVAIPHTDAIHVNKGAIAIGVLDTPVDFKMMGMPDLDVSVGIIFMLAIDNPKGQLSVLQKLMEIIQNKDILIGIKKSRTSSNIKEIVLQG